MFKNWLKITNQYKKNYDGEKPTHLLLDGGVLYVKDENLEIFLKKYIDGIEKNEKIYLVECKKEIFNFFINLDFLLDTNELNKNLFNEIFESINNTINDIYKKYFKCIITFAELKIINKITNNLDKIDEITNKKFYKQGFHIHFPEIKVNNNIALDIRKKIINDLIYLFKTIYGNNYGNIVNNLYEIVDESVYKNSGLRLTGSRKGNYLSQTKEWIDEGREYKLYQIRNENKIENYSINNENLIKETSIITLSTNLSEININMCEECEVSPDDEESQNSVGSWERLSKNSIIYEEILRFFNLWVKDYSEKDIKRIYVSDNNKTYLLNSKSKYCQNIGRNHNSEHIYFLLTSTGIVQKCFCKCNTLDNKNMDIVKIILVIQFRVLLI